MGINHYKNRGFRFPDHPPRHLAKGSERKGPSSKMRQNVPGNPETPRRAGRLTVRLPPNRIGNLAPLLE
jgi:hypothetical protein